MSTLFRKQATEFKKDRLHGELLLLPRISHTLLVSLLVIWVALLAVWLTSNSYARKETVSGWVEPQSGLTKVYSSSVGIVKRVLVSEGEVVSEGQPLVIVNGDRFLVGGGALEQELIDEYENQKRRLSTQVQRTEELYAERQTDLSRQVASAKSDLSLIGQQLKTIAEQKKIVSERHSRFEQLLKGNHVSLDEYNGIRSQLLEVESERQSLIRARINQKNELERLESQLSLLPIEKENELDQLQSALSDIARQMARLHGDRAYVVKAPKPGVVNNLQVKAGQQTGTSATKPLLTIVPENSELVAELLVPVRAAGFVGEGHTIKIRYDAFPYQKYGFYDGKVLDVSRSVMLPNELSYVPFPLQDPVYVVKAKLSEESVRAFGKKVDLKPGMTLTADIELGQRTILEWIFEPLYSLKGSV
ncbi:HlyD family secretion protein [Marinimicrobium locisalis]|uniref:HlyD family secretion protein n=1 Tax=Marinimicrobium locisalis TaxID=546022 RepID=UPI003221E08F